MVKDFNFVEFQQSPSQPQVLLARSNLGSLYELAHFPLDIQNKFKNIENARGTLLTEASTAAIVTTESCYVWKFLNNHTSSTLLRHLIYPEPFAQILKTTSLAPWVVLVPVDPEYCAIIIVSHLGQALIYKDPLSLPISLDLQFQDFIHSIHVSNWSVLVASSSKLVSIALDTNHFPSQTILERPKSIFSHFLWSSPRSILATTAFDHLFYVLTDKSLEVWNVPTNHHQQSPYFIKESINLMELIKDAFDHFQIEALIVDALNVMIVFKSFAKRRAKLVSTSSSTTPNGLHFALFKDCFSSSPSLTLHEHTVTDHVFASLRLNENLLISNFNNGLEISDATNSDLHDIIEWPSETHWLVATGKPPHSDSSLWILDVFHGILEFRSQEEPFTLVDNDPPKVLQALRNIVYFGRTAAHIHLNVTEHEIQTISEELFFNPMFVEGKPAIEKLQKQLDFFQCLLRYMMETDLIYQLSETLRESILVYQVSLECLLVFYKFDETPALTSLYPNLLEHLFQASKQVYLQNPKLLHKCNTRTISLCEVLLKVVKLAEVYLISTPKVGVQQLCELVQANFDLLKHTSISSSSSSSFSSIRTEIEQDTFQLLDFLYFMMDREPWQLLVRSFFALVQTQAFHLAVVHQDAYLLASFLPEYEDINTMDTQMNTFVTKMPEFLPYYFQQLYKRQAHDTLLEIGARYPDRFILFLQTISPSAIGGLFYFRLQEWEQAYKECAHAKLLALDHKEVALSLASLAFRLSSSSSSSSSSFSSSFLLNEDPRIQGQLDLIHFQKEMDISLHIPHYLESSLEKNYVLPVPCLIDLCRMKDLPKVCFLIRWMPPEDQFMLHVQLCRRACILLHQHPMRVSSETESQFHSLLDQMKTHRPIHLSTLTQLDDAQWLKVHAGFYNDPEGVHLEPEMFLKQIREEDQLILTLIQSSTEASQLIHKLFAEEISHVK